MGNKQGAAIQNLRILSLLRVKTETNVIVYIYETIVCLSYWSDVLDEYVSCMQFMCCEGIVRIVNVIFHCLQCDYNALSEDNHAGYFGLAAKVFILKLGTNSITIYDTFLQWPTFVSCEITNIYIHVHLLCSYLWCLITISKFLVHVFLMEAALCCFWSPV